MKNLKNKKGAIAIVSSERNNFAWDFISSLIDLKTTLNCPIIYIQVGTIAQARNHVRMLAMKHEFDWIVMVDSDMTFPKDGVHKVMETMEKMGADIGSGLYFMGSKPYLPVAFEFDTATGGYVPIKEFGAAREVGGVGMGFTVITKNAFHISFDWGALPSGKVMGEDIAFCHRAKEAGLKTIIEPSVRLGHLRTMAIDEEFIKKMT